MLNTKKLQDMFQWKMSAFWLLRQLQLVGCCVLETPNLEFWREESRNLLKAWNRLGSCRWNQKTEEIVNNKEFHAKFACDKISCIAFCFFWIHPYSNPVKFKHGKIFEGCLYFDFFAGEYTRQLVKYVLKKNLSGFFLWRRHKPVPCCVEVCYFSDFPRLLVNKVVFSVNWTAGYYWTKESRENFQQKTYSQQIFVASIRFLFVFR